MRWWLRLFPTDVTKLLGMSLGSLLHHHAVSPEPGSLPGEAQQASSAVVLSDYRGKPREPQRSLVQVLRDARQSS